jgi:hypothetical protein
MPLWRGRANTQSIWDNVSMPRKCEWIERVPSALERLRALEDPVVDRAAVEELLHLSPRQALRILSGMPGAYTAGKSLLIARPDLIAALERTVAGEGAQQEQRRRERLRDRLEATRRELLARRVHIPAEPDVRDRRIPDLPAGIHLEPGQLRIEFFGAEDLLRHLLELSQAIMNDYARFEALVEHRP